MDLREINEKRYEIAADQSFSVLIGPLFTKPHLA